MSCHSDNFLFIIILDKLSQVGREACLGASE